MAKKIKVRTPGGKVKIVKRREKVGPARCAECGTPLHGIPRLVPSKMRKLPKSRRKVNRPYGGYLCTRCMRELFKKKIFGEK